jgi:hypothetical protein
VQRLDGTGVVQKEEQQERKAYDVEYQKPMTQGPDTSAASAECCSLEQETSEKITRYTRKLLEWIAEIRLISAHRGCRK